MNIEKIKIDVCNIKIGDFIYSNDSDALYQIAKVDERFAALSVKSGYIFKTYNSISTLMESFRNGNAILIPSGDVTITLKSNEWR